MEKEIQPTTIVDREEQIPNGVVRKSVLNVVSLVAVCLCIVGMICFIIGLYQLNMGIVYAYGYHHFIKYSTINIIKGVVNISISLLFLFGAYGFTMHTIKKKEWWQKLR